MATGDMPATLGAQWLPSRRFSEATELGRLVNAHDWSTTPLGPVADWSPPLLGVTRLILAAPIPMLLLWGPDYVTVYNDAYSQVLGDRHPGVLGGTGRERMPHVWPVIEPLLERIRATGGSEWTRDWCFPVVRGGIASEAFYDISFSPVFAFDGSVGGVLSIVYETTERVRAARTLAAEREQLNRMFDAAPSFMALLREPGHVYQFANPAYHQLVGDRPLVGLSVDEAMPEMVAQGVIARLDQVVASGEAYRGSGIRVSFDRPGEPADERVLDFVYQPITDEDGRVTGVFVEGSDVTDRARAEERLALSESSLRLATEVAEVGTWDLDVPANRLEWSDRTRAMFGISPGRPATMEDFYAGLHPDDREHTSIAFASALDPERRATYDVEYRTIGKEDGVVRWVAAKGRGLFDAEGRCLRAIGTALDITQRKRAQERLRESEERFRTLADSAPALIWLCDDKGALVFANRWHEETFGRPAQELLGGGWHGILHPDDAEAFARDFDAAFDACEAFSRDVRVIDKNGATRWLHSEARPRRSEGRFVGYVGCDVDITDARMAAEALERGIAERTSELAHSNRELSAQIEERERVEATLRQMQRLEAIGQLTSGVAHDFNNLLTVVLGNLDVIARGAAASGIDEKTLKRLGYMRSAAERGATLTAQLLAFSRRQRLEARPVDLNDSVAGMRDLLQSSMGGSVKLQTQLHEDLWLALVDPTQIELIILNLAINARDAMEVGGSLHVSTSNVSLGEPAETNEPPAGDYVMIAVADNGSGMSDEVRAKAFEPFFTTKAVGKGSGLGLAQVYGFAKQSGGGVAIETELGRGTIVRVYLPRATERRRVPRAPGQGAGTPFIDATGLRFLVVDDDPAVREVTTTTLASLGAEVVAAASGAEALAILAQAEATGGFDLLVLDFAMPGMNGAEVAAAAAETWPDLPVLFVTGYADLSAIAAVSTDRIVQKPFRDDELQRKIARVLGPSVRPS